MKKRRRNSKKFLIFDFDGTIIDSNSLYYKTTSNELKKYGYTYKEVVNIIDLGFNLKKTLEVLGFFGMQRIRISKKIMKNVLKNLKKAKKCKDVESIKHLDVKKIIVSNSSKSAIFLILKHYRLKKYFKDVYGAEDFLNKTKFIKKYLKEHKIKKKDCYYIGDRVADVRVAKSAGVNGVIINGKCAWDSPEQILKAEPDIVVSSLKDLKELI